MPDALACQEAWDKLWEVAPLSDERRAVAVGGRRRLVPAAEGRIVFPPTYAGTKGTPSGYILNELDGRLNAPLDDFQSQAHRFSAMFMADDYEDLVPQITIGLPNGESLNMLQLGHRLADAIVRCAPDFAVVVRKAFDAALKGDHSLICMQSPSSLLFGVWDSRMTHFKMPRLIASRIDANNVSVRRRGMQFVGVVDPVASGLVPDTDTRKKTGKKGKRATSSIGLEGAPSRGLGGVEVTDETEIIHHIQCNLAGIRALGAGTDTKRAGHLRRYIGALALVVATAPISYDLRSGCMLVRAPSTTPGSSQIKIERYDGSTEPLEMTHSQAIDYAKRARNEFFEGTGAPQRWEATAAGAKALLDLVSNIENAQQDDESGSEGGAEA